MDTTLANENKNTDCATGLPKELGLLLILAVVFNIARIILFHSTYAIYMLWNIFLAILPFVASSYLLARAKKGELKLPLLFVGGVIWLLLLPNAPYLVTDLIHITPRHGAPLLYDAFLFFTSAWLGITLFAHSLSHLEKIITDRYGRKIAQIKIPSIILLTSIGVYIGRFLRFNSWDIIADPSFFGNTLRNFIHPVRFSEACLFILPCFFLLLMAYQIWKSRITIN